MDPRPDGEIERASFRQILGIRFFVGPLAELLPLVSQGGLIVVPAAPALANLPRDSAYRDALESSDLAITDSGFLMLLWLLRKGELLNRISGLRFLRGLLAWPVFREPGATFWIMPSEKEAHANSEWLAGNGLQIQSGNIYIAPIYPQGNLADATLISLIEARRPKFIILGLGGGVQERLGLSLRQSLSYKPAIICTGAAIAFLSGCQPRIPVWADALMLGWLIRCLRAPRKFLPRYWHALRLVPIFMRDAKSSPGRTIPPRTW